MADTDAIKHTLWDKMAESPFVMVGLVGGEEHSEPLTVQLDKDQVDTLFFFAGAHNRATKGGKAMVQFVSKGHDFFACLMGDIHVDNDFAMIDKLWSTQVEAWFPGGKHDPDLALLRLDIHSAELWENDMSLPTKLKLIFGTRIDAGEEGNHAKVDTTAT